MAARKNIGLAQTILKERYIYRQHILQLELQQTEVENHIRTCDGGNFKIMLFLQFGKTTKFQESHMIIFYQKIDTCAI